MKLRPIQLVLAAAAAIALGCASPTSDTQDVDDGTEVDDDTQDEEEQYLILDARASCDPSASALDDLFIFEVETIDDVEDVEVDVYVGSGRTGTVRLSERSSGNWYGEEWADDLNSDCDEFSSMLFEVIAEKGDVEDAVEINPD